MASFRVRRNFQVFIIAFGYIFQLSNAQQTTSLSVTMTAAGPLGTFNPPDECTSFSAYSTQTLVFGDGNTRSFTLTSFRQGCQYGGPHTTCCPPDYELGQFNSPGVCPGGYTTLGDIEFVGVTQRTEGFWITYAPIGTKTGKLCCPRRVPNKQAPQLVYAHWLTLVLESFSAPDSISYKADGPVPICLATSKGPTITQEGSVINHESIWFASAVVVVPPGASDAPLPSVTASSNTVSRNPSSSRSSLSTGQGVISEPGTSVGESEPQNTSQPGDSPSGGGGLSGGAIAGIAVGVAVPVVLVGLYLAYRFGKRNSKEPEKWGTQNRGVAALDYGDAGREPGVAPHTEIGGIQGSR
ncbi:hypothetical protein ABW19_dt0202157 [Dactylella cylindrospora]|nr:hypothetical protein ABW19_dt0202157 [Dactylella cylindrospora]